MLKKFVAAMLSLLAAVAFAAVDANKATLAELEAVKGIGPAIAGKILDERKKGNFKDWNDMITRVQGVGEGNAVKFSEAGLTVAGATFKGAAPAAPAAAKPATPATPATPAAAAKPAAAPAPVAAPATSATPAKPAVAAMPAKADDKAMAKADPKADKEAAKKAMADEKAKAKADKEAKPVAAAASGAKK